MTAHGFSKLHSVILSCVQGILSKLAIERLFIKKVKKTSQIKGVHDVWDQKTKLSLKQAKRRIKCDSIMCAV